MVTALWSGIIVTVPFWTRLGVREGVRHPMRWFVIGAVVAVIPFGRGLAEKREPNRYGFYPSFIPLKTHVVPSNKPGVPAQVVRTNSLGFRDKEWATEPAPGVRRIVVVGDSFVFGSGIATEEGLLHRQIENRLNESGPGRWEALNFAMLPSGLWYYVHALIQAISTYPQALVMSYLGSADLSVYDDQYIKFGLSGGLVYAALKLGVLQDFMWARARISGSYEHRGAPPSELERSRKEFDLLVRELERSGIPLIVWLPYGPDGFFDPYRGHPLISVLSREDLPKSPGQEHWSRDPALSIQGDGHPTEAGNVLFSRTIARGVLDAIRRRRPMARDTTDSKRALR